MAGAPAGHDVFLSYGRADAATAETLRARLRDAGLSTFLDRYALPADRPWQPELEAALASCRALLVLLGPSGIGGWQHREIQLALDRQTGAEKTPTPFLVISILPPCPEPTVRYGRPILARRRASWFSTYSRPWSTSSVG